MPLSKQDAQAFLKELDGLSVDDLNARNEELEAERHAVREKQRLLVGARAAALRAERVKESEASIDRQGMRPKPGAATAKGGRPG